MLVAELEEEVEGEAAQQYCPSQAAEAMEFLATWFVNYIINLL